MTTTKNTPTKIEIIVESETIILVKTYFTSTTIEEEEGSSMRKEWTNPVIKQKRFDVNGILPQLNEFLGAMSHVAKENGWEDVK
jgi:hypothetical protein